MALLDFIREKQIKYMIFNTLKLKTIFPIHLQKWIAKHVNSKLIRIMDRIAIVEPQEPIANLSLQMYVEETNKFGPLAEEHFFKTEQQALRWLLGE